MKIDTVRGVIAQLTAGGAVFVSMAMLYSLIAQGKINGDAGLAILTTIIGAAVTFLFGNETATRAVRSFQSGLNTPGPNDSGTTVNADTATVTGEPVTVKSA